MSQDIARYIEIVGKDNLKKDLKENLKVELTKAIAVENWQLVKEITGLVESVFSKHSYAAEQDLMRCVEIIGIHKLNSEFLQNLKEAIEDENWITAREIAEIFQKNLNNINVDNSLNTKSNLKAILSKLIKQEDWYLASLIMKLIEKNFNYNKSQYSHEHGIKIDLKEILNQLIAAKKYSFAMEIGILIENNFMNIYQSGKWLKIKEIVVEQLEVELDRVKITSNLREDLGCDDLDFVELIMVLEEKFDIEIGDQKKNIITTVHDLFDMVVFSLQEELIIN